MKEPNRKNHWENIYRTKETNAVSWYQAIPQTSIDFFTQLKVPFDAKIIDVGAGDSLLVDHLLEAGYTDITILDISELAIQRAQMRLGNRAEKVKWINADASNFEAPEQYDFWHDRAAFHFLTEDHDISNYLSTAHRALRENGILVLGTFSDQGPKTCSGIEIKQYSAFSLTERVNNLFQKISCFTVDHTTPFDSIQNFLFCSFRK